VTAIEKNRRNAQRSTGPRSQAGKAAASRNALRHGLTAGAALIPGEDPAAFEGMAARLREELAPVGELEVQLTARMAAALWRLHRLGRVEAGIFEQGSQGIPGLNLRALGFTETDEQEPEETDKAPPGLAFIRDGNGADAFSKLSRYEAGIERALYRALHEYQRVRAARMGAALPPPAVLDVDLEVTHNREAP
jgi:hypothetical protein